MTPLTISSFEIKKARSQDIVPVINGVHLHSCYNPKKEASIFISKYLDQIAKSKHVIVFGLGFGYHVFNLIETLEKIHGNNYKIIIIEPCLVLLSEFRQHFSLQNNNVLIYCEQDIADLFSDSMLMEFIADQPLIIPHPPSFNLFKQYYNDLLTLKVPDSIGFQTTLSRVPEIKNYLLTQNQELNLYSFLHQDLLQKKSLQNMDFLAMALSEITKRSTQINNHKASCNN